jgi:hypothetical protein
LVARVWRLSLFYGLCLSAACAALPASAQQAQRTYRLSSDLARPVVRILADDFAADGRYRNGTGVLVGRCDVVLTAQHVAVSAGGFDPAVLQVYSPQVRGKAVGVTADKAARALWPRPADARGNLDGDLAVLRLSACPTQSYVPLSQLRPITFADLKRLKSVGFACDSGHKRAPEQISLRGRFRKVETRLGLSRSIRLTPGARSGQSGSPIYALAPGKPPALTMIMAATERGITAPVGCGQDPITGTSPPGAASYGAVLSAQFIEALGIYVRGLE